MKKLLYLLALPFLLISCSDNDPSPKNSDLANLGDIEVFEPDGPIAINNPYGRPAIEADIDGEHFFKTHPESFDAGLVNIIRTTEYNKEGKLTFSLKNLDIGTYVLGDSSGFTQAFYNNIPCSHGVLRIHSHDDGIISGSFEFEAGDHEINNGFIYDVLVEETFDRGQNHEISATINGEKWEAELFDGNFLAASFVISGYNPIGNVRLDIHTSSFNEPGVYDLLDNNGFTGIAFKVAKEEPALKSGHVQVLSTENGVRGKFSVEFEGYTIRNGRFHLLQ